MPRKRHIPERTCVACGDKRPKAELVRIARSPQGAVSVDPRGKAPGRGAYVCGTRCLDTALARNRLSRSLGQMLSTDDLETLRLDLSSPNIAKEDVAVTTGTVEPAWQVNE